ncbi:flagellar assembly peptidoglycan hydrolase FlgJ [Rhodanobacter ginsengisoli]|uniref:Peptidoglycan hydrolase FlgJ n=1 Tax=Rhodanobacter ginsengisoli TaxID=418646 RepID=A0ABW0QIK1_9GAMM
MAIGGDPAMQSLNTWTDLSGFSALRQQAQTDSKAALPVVAKQFESIFTQMVLKSMREANYGDKLFDSQAGDAWQGLFDQQLSVSLSSKGHGLGIADMLVRQLGGHVAGAAGQPVAAGDPGQPAAGSPDNWKERLGTVVDAVSSASESVSRWVPGDPADFVRQLAPYAKKAAEKLGVSLRAVLAQAALETQWGKHMPTHADGSSSNNLFGIKAGSGWDGGRVNVPTLEFEGGVAVRRHAHFRAYESPQQSFDDYARLIGDNPRYAAALGKGDDVLGFARGLISGSYATDPAYASKIAAIANSPAMRQALSALKNAVKLPTSSE